MRKGAKPGFNPDLSRLMEKMEKLPPEEYTSWAMDTENGTALTIDFNKATGEVILTSQPRDDYHLHHLYFNNRDARAFKSLWLQVVELSRLGRKDGPSNDMNEGDEGEKEALALAMQGIAMRCKAGHLLTRNNLIASALPSRRCRTCHNEYQAKVKRERGTARQ